MAFIINTKLTKTNLGYYDNLFNASLSSNGYHSNLGVLTFVHNEKNNAAALGVGNMIVSRRRKVEQAKNKILEYSTMSLT